MAFHFPVMPRMFMSLRREDATPIYEILAQTPAIPENCQWGLFLRNHDELTLEMVTDEERDYMYAEYAKDPRMKLNLGIRRRLAPLLDNGRDEIELMHAILFSLPGSPVLYYGDEIGMGDNIYLGDRDGVRTPMHWTGDRNAGFSKADFHQLYLPPLMDPVYGYPAVNVEAQLRTPTSRLRWLRRLIELRKQHPVFGLGSYEGLPTSNPRVFAHVRRHEDDVVLAVHNLARSAQAVELDLSRFAGRVPVEMFGHSRFPRVGELPYLLTLGPRGFFWFLLQEERVVSEQALAGPLDVLDEQALVDYVKGQRWYGSKASDARHAQVLDAVPLRTQAPLLASAIVELRFQAGTHELYQLLVGMRPAEEGWSEGVIAERDGWTLYDALADPRPRPRAGLDDARRARRPGRPGLDRVRRARALALRRPAAAAAGRRRAVELLGHLRRPAHPQGLPPPRGRHQPRAGAAPVPHAARLPQHGRAGRVVRVHRAADRRHARRAPGVRARTRATAGRSRSTSWRRTPRRSSTGCGAWAR